MMKDFNHFNLFSADDALMCPRTLVLVPVVSPSLSGRRLVRCLKNKGIRPFGLQSQWISNNNDCFNCVMTTALVVRH